MQVSAGARTSRHEGAGSPDDRDRLPLLRQCDLSEILPFGDTPIADRLVAADDPAPEFVAPLTLMHCNACGLCQIRETVAPRVLFGPDYPYYSSVSPALMRHFRRKRARHHRPPRSRCRRPRRRGRLERRLHAAPLPRGRHSRAGHRPGGRPSGGSRGRRGSRRSRLLRRGPRTRTGRRGEAGERVPRQQRARARRGRERLRGGIAALLAEDGSP
jgi:hypothetical protein